MTSRVCVSCGHTLRAQSGRWVHNTPRGHLLDNNHRAVLGTYHGEPVALPAPPPAVRAPRKPQRPIAPLPQPVNWGPPVPWERRKFDPELTRRRGCETAAGLDTIGEL